MSSMTCSFWRKARKNTLWREGAQKVRVELGFHSGAPLRTKRDIFPVTWKNQSSFWVVEVWQSLQMVHNKEEFSSVSGGLWTRRGIIIQSINRKTGVGEFKLMICFVEMLNQHWYSHCTPLTDKSTQEPRVKNLLMENGSITFLFPL